MFNKSLATITLLSLTLPTSIVASEVSAINTEAVKQDIAQAHKPQSNEELAKELANPIANLISLPMQLNYDRGFLNTSGNDSNRWTLNVQPVIPFSISDDWNVISRTIVPLIRTDNFPLGSGTTYGVGDVVQSLFFSPKAPTDSGWIWGAGPVFLIPSGSDVSADTWGAGPTAVVLKQEGSWTYGGFGKSYLVYRWKYRYKYNVYATISYLYYTSDQGRFLLNSPKRIQKNLTQNGRKHNSQARNYLAIWALISAAYWSALSPVSRWMR